MSRIRFPRSRNPAWSARQKRNQMYTQKILQSRRGYKRASYNPTPKRIQTFQDPDASTTAVFTPFQHLPVELRLKIWRFSFRGRNVEVNIDINNHGIDGIWPGPNRLLALQSLTPPPSTLFVNSESRTETLRHYFELFPGKSDFPVYFNARIDSLDMHSICLKLNSGQFPKPLSQAAYVHEIMHTFGCLDTELLKRVESLTLTRIGLYFSRTRPVGRLTSNQPPLQVDRDGPDYHKLENLLHYPNLREIVIVGKKVAEGSRKVSGFEDPQATEECHNAFNDLFESHPECRNPKIKIFPEPFAIPIFIDEMQTAYDDRIYEDFDLEETVDWFESEF